MRILVVGAGIGGLAAAGFLERKGFDVTLVEQAPEFKHIGFSMSLYSNGRRLLRELGIDDEVGKEGYAVPSLELSDAQGHVLGQKINMKEFQHFGEEPIISIERAVLHNALVKNLKNTTLMLGTTIKKIKSEKDKVHIELSNGTWHTFNLLVAADGIHSKIRQEFFRGEKSLPYGWSLRFFWLPAHIPVPRGITSFSRAGATITLYPIKERCCVGIYEYNPRQIKKPPLSVENFLPSLEKHGWTKNDIVDLEKELKEGKQYYDNLHYIPLGPWFKKRIVLVGDARHGLSPFTGMGASLALEDAFILADELAKVQISDVDLALKNYARRRDPRVKKIISLSRFMERFFLIKTRLGQIIRNALLSVFPETILTKKLEAILIDNV